MNQTVLTADMPDCAGMSQADGQCNLKVICAAVPLLNEMVIYGFFPPTASVYPQAHVAFSPMWHSPLERIPIFLM